MDKLRAWLFSLGILLQLGKCAGFYSRAAFVVRPSTRGLARVLGLPELGKESWVARRGRQGWRLGMARKESEPPSPQAGCAKVVGGGGYPVTPKFTQRRFMQLSQSNASHRDVIQDMGIVREDCATGEWLLLTDKRSKLREVFALETSVVRRGKELMHARSQSPAC